MGERRWHASRSRRGPSAKKWTCTPKEKSTALAQGGQQAARANLMRFLERMRGARTAAPSSEEPVMKIPHAAPRTERPMARPAPTKAHAYGSISSITCRQHLEAAAADVSTHKIAKERISSRAANSALACGAHRSPISVANDFARHRG